MPPKSLAEVADALEIDFLNPPADARPLVWWHWMNGNVTKDGIRKDLEWMKRVGIGGMQRFEIGLATPQIVPDRLVFQQPEWNDIFHYTATLADTLNLELSVMSAPGWSETGGPWVEPEDALKKLVWSEATLEGGCPFRGQLAQPATVNGPFRTMTAHDPLAAFIGNPVPDLPTYYADIAVIAYPLDPHLNEGSVAQGTIEDCRAFDIAMLNDGDLATGIDLPPGDAANPATMTLAYATPRTVQSATLFVVDGMSFFTGPAFAPRLEASDDGYSWRHIADIPAAEVPTTVSFPPVTASQYRVVLVPAAPDMSNMQRGSVPGIDPGPLMQVGSDSDKPIRIAEFRLSSEAKVDQFERKAGFALVPDYYALSGHLPDSKGIATDKIIDLTDRMKPDGALDWTPPDGRWRVVRLGCSLTGATNHAAPTGMTGLEVDKLDGEAVRRYLDVYLGVYRTAASDDLIGERGLRGFLTDSIEVGPSNWTPRMLEQFRRLRGYDPTPYLLALTGVVVGSRSQSDKFLYDYRRTLADLMASEHYGTIAQVAHEYGLRYYSEALEDGRPSLGDDMAMRSHADVPMGAIWPYTRETGPRPSFVVDMKGAASVAHVLGKPLVGTEALTSLLAPWAYAPADLRRFIDLAFVMGVNRPSIQASTHHPDDDRKPGLSLGIFGQHFNRHETWAEMARPWVDYIARSSALLQVGRDVADVAYFYGEEAPLTALYLGGPVPDAPRAYAWDFVNADIVLGHLHVERGEIITSGGARYRLLYLGGTSRRMTLPVLRRLAELVEAGATVVGDAPDGSPGLDDDPAAFAASVQRLWSGKDVTDVGQGRVIAGRNVAAALARIGVAPDFATPDGEAVFLHRRVGDTDLYFVCNQRNQPTSFEALFRVTGKAPEFWHADTGAINSASYRMEGGHTAVPLDLAAEESVFVVFRRCTTETAVTIPEPQFTTVTTLLGDWSVAFEQDRGAPASVKLAQLSSLTDQTDPGIRYFSGIATYANSFDLPRESRPDRPLLLDLGSVGDVAEVSVNGRFVGTVWHEPYRLDIAAESVPGRNRLEVRVANLWANRLIGDAQPGARKVTWTSVPTYLPDAPLRPAGLMGPVTLLVEAEGHD